MDYTSLEAARQAVEQACVDMEDIRKSRQADVYLLELRESQHAIAVCQHILNHSRDSRACFQAANALQYAALRKWVTLGREGQLELREKLLDYLLRATSSALQEQVVILQLTRALAILLKRSWLSETMDANFAFFRDMEGRVQAANTPATQRLLLQIYEAFVSEFSPATASPMGLPWEAHERCRASLEIELLDFIFMYAAEKAHPAAPAALRGQDDGVCLACLSLMSALLTWEFRAKFSSPYLRDVHSISMQKPLPSMQLSRDPSAPMAAYGSGRPFSNWAHIRPTIKWRGLVVDLRAFNFLLNTLLPNFSGQAGASHPLAAPSRQIVVLLCAVTGEIFPKESQDRRKLYLSRLLTAIMRWICPPHDVLARAKHDDAELLDACRAISALAPIYRTAGLDFALLNPADENSPPRNPLLAIAELTCACLAQGGLSEAHADTWVAEASELLLDAWVELLADDSFSPQARPSRTAQEAAAHIFRSFVHARLVDVADGADDDEAEGEAEGEEVGAGAAREASFAGAAALGRAASGPSCQLLLSLLHAKRAALQQAHSSGQSTSVPLEEMTWLLRTTAHLIADPGEGETPVAPQPIIAAAAELSAQGQPDLLVALSQVLVENAALCADPAAIQAISPRFAEAAIWAAARWSDTYLLPDSSIPALPAMQQAYGPGSSAAEHTLAILVRVALSALTNGAFAGEVDLHRVAVVKLLPALMRRKHVAAKLVALPEWQQLAAAFAEQAEGIRALAAPVLKGLAQALTNAASGIASPEHIGNYISHVFHTVTGEVQQTASQRAGMSVRALGLIDCLRGLARGTTARTQAATRSVARSCLPALEALALTAVKGRQSEATALLLKLAAELVEAHVSYLQRAEAWQLCAWAQRLIQGYAEAARGTRSVAPTAALRADAEADTARELKALLKLLSNLTQRELIDFSEEEGPSNQQPPPDIAQAVLAGLDVLIPIMTGELLQFPKLCHDYFALLCHMMELHPERIASLPGLQMDQLFGTLEWGVQSGHVEVAQASLEALAAMALSQFQAIRSRGSGYSGLSRAGGLERFMWSVLQKLLACDSARDVTDSAADALLPLILAFPHAFQRLGDDLLASQVDPAAQYILAQWLQSLLPTRELKTVDRPIQRQFRKLLTSFLADARGLLRMQ